jgi:hypothetical protein
MTKDLDAISDILRKAFQVEVDGFTFYSMALERATKPAVRKLFERLARDETEHKAYIMAVMKRYEEHGARSFQFDPRDPDLGEFSSQIFTENRSATRIERRHFFRNRCARRVGPADQRLLPLSRRLGRSPPPHPAAALRQHPRGLLA